MTVHAGGSLEQRVGAPMPVRELLPLAIRLAAEVAELHQRGEIHGVFEPANILFDAATGEPVLASSPIAARSAATLLEGSLPYISPEQTGQLNRPIDNRSDLYSLGIVLYQLLAGRLPFEAEDAIGWVHCHVARQPQPLDQLRPELPRPLVDIVAKLLAKLPDQRYQIALGLRHDLELPARVDRARRARGVPVRRARRLRGDTLPRRAGAVPGCAAAAAPRGRSRDPEEPLAERDGDDAVAGEVPGEHRPLARHVPVGFGIRGDVMNTHDAGG